MHIHTQARVRGAAALAFLLALSLVATLPALAQTETVLHSFARNAMAAIPRPRSFVIHKGIFTGRPLGSMERL